MESNANTKYSRAQKRVKDIKGFYTHLAIYVVVNLIIIIVKNNFFQVFSSGELNFEILSWRTLDIFGTPLFWGIGLFFHGLYVFGPRIRFINNWEERKIKEFMKENENTSNNWD